MRRTVVWFSCGAASACALKIAMQQCENVHAVYCDTFASEHPDNARFLAEVSAWAKCPIDVIGSKKYLTIDDVFETTRYMAGIKGARCTVEMKKVPRFAYQRPDDVHVFGLTADEEKRIDLFVKNNPELDLHWLLKENQVTKADCYGALRVAGIKLPAMYGMGFKNNNCIGCVKATSVVYWQRVRQHFPEHYALRAKQSRQLNVRLVRYKGKRIFLEELPLDATAREPEEDIECGPVCIGVE